MNFSFVKTARYLLPISFVLVLASLVVLIYPGPKMSIEFTGGTLLEVALPADKTKTDLDSALQNFKTASGAALNSVSISKTNEGTYLARMMSISNEEHLQLSGYLQQKLGKVQEKQFTTIGPTVGASLKSHAFLALGAAALAIIVYLSFAFRKVPRKLSPWRFGLIAVIAQIHDLMITVGIFVVLSHFTSFQVDTLFVTALLSIMGYSVNDTIIIFDRIRDNLSEERKMSNFAELADTSLKQTLGRTLNTVIATLIMLFSLFFLGSESVRWFILTLIIGTIIGTYSSFFIATPLLVWSRKKS